MSSDYREKGLAEHGELCAICGDEENIEIHHKDGDRTNNDTENLIPVCAAHHRLIHGNGEKLAESTGENGDTLVTTTVRLSEKLIEDIDVQATIKGISRSEYVRTKLSEAMSGQRPVPERPIDLERELARADQRHERTQELLEQAIKKL